MSQAVHLDAFIRAAKDYLGHGRTVDGSVLIQYGRPQEVHHSPVALLPRLHQILCHLIRLDDTEAILLLQYLQHPALAGPHAACDSQYELTACGQCISYIFHILQLPLLMSLFSVLCAFISS